MMQFATKKMTKDVGLNTNPIKSKSLYVAILFLFFLFTFVFQNSSLSDLTDDTTSARVEDVREISADNNSGFDDNGTHLGVSFYSNFFAVVFYCFFIFSSTEAQPQRFLFVATPPRAPPL